jgi:hypothetical protein
MEINNIEFRKKNTLDVKQVNAIKEKVIVIVWRYLELKQFLAIKSELLTVLFIGNPASLPMFKVKPCNAIGYYMFIVNTAQPQITKCTEKRCWAFHPRLYIDQYGLIRNILTLR